MEKKQSERIGYLFVFIGGAMWGLIGIFVKELNRVGSTSELTSFLRVFFAFLILLLITVLKEGWQCLRIDRKTLLICALLGIICNGICNIVYNLAVTMIGMAVSAVLMNTAPIFALIFSMLCFGETCTGRKLAAIVINIIGCVFAATNGKFDVATLSLAGILLGVASGFCYSMTAIIGKFAANRTSTLVMNTYSALFATLFLVFWMRPWSVEIMINSEIIAWSFGFALIPTVLSYIFYYAGLHRIAESSKVPVIASIEVVVAVVLGVIIYQEKLSIAGVMGIVLVLVSILIMNIKGIAK